MFGNNITVRFTDPEKKNIILHNVTEIHYKYPSRDVNRIAFESDIHKTEMTYNLDDITEFDLHLANLIHDEF